ncbi:MAG: A/G-specific adenine glycosylase [Phycisphaerales bacterium]|nr:A/G-specific adenine glycosylase [Phycisphaerales bacterium]
MSSDKTDKQTFISCVDKSLERELLRWFWQARREMPWRQTTDPYAIWLSEMMLQQTQIDTVRPYWSRFVSKYPDLSALSSANLQEVLALWAGLGYYRRARNLHAAAKLMIAEFGGKVPESVEELMRLPGVGRYTAGAVASIAFGKAVPVVDGNVMRVLARLTGNAADIAEPKNVQFFWELAERMHSNLAISKHKLPQQIPAKAGAIWVQRHLHGDLNEALMELGAMICTPSSPSCLLCPLRQSCCAFEQGRQNELPVKTKKGRTPVVRALAVVIRRFAGGASEVLLMQRPEDGLWADMWEFPVIEAPAGAQRLRAPGLQSLGLRVSDEIGLRLKEFALCGQVRHQLTHRLFAYTVLCATVQGKSDVIRRPNCPGSHLPYRTIRWVPWPLPKSPAFPLARVVHKIAAVADSDMRPSKN